MSNNVDRPPKSSQIRDPNRGSTEKFRPTGPTSSYSSAAHPEVAMSHQQNRRKVRILRFYICVMSCNYQVFTYLILGMHNVFPNYFEKAEYLPDGICPSCNTILYSQARGMEHSFK